eukprot:jgi/Bigna1/72052/fgenesh1_pg.18_\
MAATCLFICIMLTWLQPGVSSTDLPLEGDTPFMNLARMISGRAAHAATLESAVTTASPAAIAAQRLASSTTMSSSPPNSPSHQHPIQQHLRNWKDTAGREFSKAKRVGEVFRRAATIYCSYKANTIAVSLKCKGDLTKRKELMGKLHDLNSDRMAAAAAATPDAELMPRHAWVLCEGRPVPLDKEAMDSLVQCSDERTACLVCRTLKDFVLISSRSLLNRELGLCFQGDSKPASSSGLIQRGDKAWQDVFTDIDFERPLGSASIAQVHSGRLHDGTPVAIKLQNPEAEELMQLDLECLKIISAFLSKTGEVKFDLSTAVVELKKQILEELDFRKEARTMSEAAERLSGRAKNVQIPTPISGPPDHITPATLESHDPLQQQKAPSAVEADGTRTNNDDDNEIYSTITTTTTSSSSSSNSLRLRAGREIVDRMAQLWGMMVMEDGFFHADPHPGNILIIPNKYSGWLQFLNWVPFVPPGSFDLGVIDWGQVKRIDDDFRHKLGRLFVSIARTKATYVTFQVKATGNCGFYALRQHANVVIGEGAEIAADFHNLGIRVENASDTATVIVLARTMFDTKKYEGDEMNLFNPNCTLHHNAVESLPKNLFLVLRTVQIIRGLAFTLGIHDYSLAEKWGARYSDTLLPTDRTRDCGKGKGSGMPLTASSELYSSRSSLEHGATSSAPARSDISYEIKN